MSTTKYRIKPSNKFNKRNGVVQLTLPSDILSVQVKFGSCYITGQYGEVWNKRKKT